MNNHLAIQVNGKYLTVNDDFAIDIEDVNPYFDDSESFSYETQIPINGNRHLLQNVDDVQTDMRMLDLENSPMRIEVEGMPFRNGKMLVSDEDLVQDSVSFSMVNGNDNFTDLIADMKCTDVPVKDKIQIGEMIGDLNVYVDYDYRFQFITKGVWPGTLTRATDTFNFNLQALGYSFPGICNETSGYKAVQSGGKPSVATSFINVSDPYPTKPYCNARVCYTHYQKGTDGQTSSEISTTGTYDPYYVLEANRAQSGICFYVLYFLDCLFAELGLAFDNTSLTGMGDLNRLAFFTTKCKYDLERKRSGREDFTSVDAINAWLSSRNTNGAISTLYSQYKKINSAWLSQGGSTGKVYKVGDKWAGAEIRSIEYKVERIDQYVRGSVMNMYANSYNFPESTVSEIIDSLWNSFGIKMMYNSEHQSVTAYLIRDLYRNTQPAITIRGSVVSIVPIVEKTSGFKMGYSAESSNKDKQDNIKRGKTDYDTNYDYADYRKVDSSLSYLSILRKQGNSDMTCYIDRTTGNAYRLKVNSDAEKVSELKPALFEVGGYKGVEIGDCSLSNEDNIVEMISDFEPVIFNDVNSNNLKAQENPQSHSVSAEEQTVTATPVSDTTQILAAFIDEDMGHENIEMQCKLPAGSDYLDYSLIETFSTDEAYDPSSTDDGNSPLQHYDWGNAIAIMRGGGADATIEAYDYNYDGFNNSKWRTISGQYAMSSDSLDDFGAEYDYNGTLTGIGDEERMSLKVRAFKEVDDQILCNADVKDEDGNITTKVRSRGLFDTFMSEHAHFLLNRKKYLVTIKCEAAELVEIPQNWHRRYNVGGVTGWINKINTRISVANGLELVEIEMLSL